MLHHPQHFVDVDVAAGVYHFCAPNLCVHNIGARLFYTASGQDQILDLVHGATVASGQQKIAGAHWHLTELETQYGPVAATLSLRYRQGEPRVQISAKVQLVGDDAEVQLQSVVLFQTHFDDTFLADFGRENCRFWINSHDIWLPTGSAPLSGPVLTTDLKQPLAYHFASLYCASQQSALTFAYQMPNQWLDAIEWSEGNEVVAKNKIGVTLVHNRPVQTDLLNVYLGPSFTEALPKMHDGHTPRRSVTETRDNFGWNSWEAYQTGVTEADILENMEEIAKLPWLRERIRHITIDDGWQRNRTDWFPNEKFPDGMDGMAAKIRSYGFQPGIWTAPFLVAKGSEILADHPDWLIHEGELPLARNDTYFLDPTHPEARGYIYDVYCRLYNWGYRTYKTDFLVEAPMFFVPGRPEYRATARCYDPNLGIMRGMRATMQTIRAAIGEDSFWLGCGTDIGSGALLMDASRTGGDIAPFWTRVPNQARSVIHHFHLHGNLFLADPDFMLAKSSDTFYPEYLDVPLVSDEAYKVDAWRGGRCFDADDVCTWASLVILSGGLLNLSDRVKGLNELGLSIIQIALQYAGGNAAVPIDVESPIPRILLREEKSHYLLGLLNWDNEASISLTVNEAMGIPFPACGIVSEIWSGATKHIENGGMTVELAPHRSLLFSGIRVREGGQRVLPALIHPINSIKEASKPTMWNTISRHLIIILVALLLTITPTWAADAPSQPDLRSLINSAIASKQSRLVIPPGVYRVSPAGNEGALININNVHNMDIVADGVLMVCTKRMRALALTRCENVTLRGLTIDYDPLTFTQGTVVAMADDKGWLDIKLDAGYPQILFDRIVICDPKTRFHKYGIDHLWGTKASWAEPGTIRITRPNVAINVDLGDPVALSGGQEMGACHGITVEDHCSNVVFNNVTLNCAPGMGLVDYNNETGIKMFGCKIVPGPKPAGAIEDRLLTTSWDGLQCNVARVGAQIENCVIERCGDDSWSVPTRDFKVIERDGKTLLLRIWDGGLPLGGLQVGDHLIRRGPDGNAVQAITALGIVNREIDGKKVSLIQATLDVELPAEPGDYLFNLDRSSKGFIYRNNHIYSHGRGALIKVGDGIVEGNTFRGSDKAIMVNCELDGGAGGVDHLIIRNNTIIETGYHQAMPWSEQAGAICLSATAGHGKLHAAGSFTDILIENNTFDRVKGLNLLITSARNVTVKNNRFLNTHTTDPKRHNGADYNIDATAVIEVTQSDGVKFIGNTIQNMGPFAKRAVLIDPSAQNVTDVDTGVCLVAK